MSALPTQVAGPSHGKPCLGRRPLFVSFVFGYILLLKSKALWSMFVGRGSRDDSIPDSRGLLELTPDRKVLLSNSTSLTGAELLTRPFASRIIVSEKARILYCPIPKIASSNWKFLIRKLEGVDDYFDLSRAHLPDTSGLRYLSDYSPSEVEHLLTDNSFFKFAFVRDPYARALSCYMDKFLNTDDGYVKTEYRAFLAQLYEWRYARWVDVTSEPRPSFADFVDEIAKQRPIEMNEHWMPQHLLCGFGEMPYDFIGRLENLQRDSQYVLERIGHSTERFPTQEDIGFPPSGASSRSSDDFFSVQLMMKLRVVYDVDFNSLSANTSRSLHATVR